VYVIEFYSLFVCSLLSNSCTFPGYKSFYTNLKRYLQKQTFADNIVIIGKQDFARSGNFEVWVGETLVHSNKTRRDGYANRAKDREAICQAIELSLKERHTQ
jgi:hypothetical protein